MAHIHQQMLFPLFHHYSDPQGRFILLQYPNVFFYAKVDKLLLSNINY